VQWREQLERVAEKKRLLMNTIKSRGKAWIGLRTDSQLA